MNCRHDRRMRISLTCFPTSGRKLVPESNLLLNPTDWPKKTPNDCAPARPPIASGPCREPRPPTPRHRALLDRPQPSTSPPDAYKRPAPVSFTTPPPPPP